MIGGGAPRHSRVGGGDGAAASNRPRHAPARAGAVFSIGNTSTSTTAPRGDDRRHVRSSRSTTRRPGCWCGTATTRTATAAGRSGSRSSRPTARCGRVCVVTEETVHSDATRPSRTSPTREDNGSTTSWCATSTDDEEARSRCPTASRGAAGRRHRSSLSGDNVYVGTDDTPATVNWRTGDVAETDALEPGFPQVFGGRDPTDGWPDRRRRTGRTLLERRRRGLRLLQPLARRSLRELCEDDGGRAAAFDVYDVDSGSHVASTARPGTTAGAARASCSRSTTTSSPPALRPQVTARPPSSTW